MLAPEDQQGEEHPMATSEYSYFTRVGICSKCGAGPHNENVHDENCLINAPKGTVRHWHNGFHGIGLFGESSLLTEDAQKATAMGAALAGKVNSL
jgi:hypothetical protein